MNSPIDNNDRNPMPGEQETAASFQDEPEVAIPRDFVSTGVKKKSRMARLLNRRWKKIVFGIVAALLAIVIVCCATFGVLWFSGRHALLSTGDSSFATPSGYDIEIEDDGQTVTYNGNTYVYNTNMTSVLCIGVDRKNENTTYDVNGKNGQADALFLAAIDTQTGKTDVIAISRDLMTEVKVYSEEGKFIGVENKQVCLAYAYGDGETGSCENTVSSVSKLLYGMPINTYFSMDWAAISVLNDAVGGVSVPEYDSDWNPTGNMVTLSGKSALDYIHMRDKSDLESNSNRVERQVNYLKSFASKTIEKTRSDLSVPLNLYNKLSKYSVSTLDASRITYLTTVFMDGGASIDFLKVPGTIRQGEKYAEMYADEQALYEMILDVFYTLQ